MAFVAPEGAGRKGTVVRNASPMSREPGPDAPPLLPPQTSLPRGKLLVDAGWPTWMVLHSTLAPSDVGCLGTVTLKNGEGKFSFLCSSIIHGLNTVCLRSNPNLSGPYQGLLLTEKEEGNEQMLMGFPDHVKQPVTSEVVDLAVVQ